MAESLKEYRKRRTGRTPEPMGGKPSKDGPVFVVQEHKASTHHYDFRIEVDGVLKSWAVPKGPSTDPRIKRLAMPTENHPLDYATFEGVIPEDSYGAGTVIVWDRGSYDNITEKNGKTQPMATALETGHALIFLHGEKLRGGYALQRTGRGEDARWLLVKMKDDQADARRNPVSTEPESVLSGRTVEGVEDEPSRTMPDPFAQLSEGERDRLRPAEHPAWTAPMLATLTEKRFSDPEWLFERKLDGERALSFRHGDRLRLLSRNRHELNASYPELADALMEQPCADFVADGEIVAFEGKVTSFTRLQGRMQTEDPERASDIAVYYYLFDLLHLDGHDLSGLPLRSRKTLLRQAIAFDDPIRFTPHRNSDGEAFLREACQKGWEGLIAKRASGPYRHTRSSQWLKLKCTRGQELVIGGFTAPKGEREGFGALLLGYYDDGKLRYAGKVGTGFDDAFLREMRSRLDDLAKAQSPYAEEVREAEVTYVEPELVAEIGFTEWTRAGRLRHPRFLGLRRDKDAKEVTRERAEN